MLLAFDDYGPGPVVVLLHGFPLNRSLWSAQESVVGAVYRVIAPDLRGHGETAAPSGVYTIDAMADDVIETLDALQLREPVVVGALSAVLRYPDRFRALMLMDTRAGADSPETARGRETLATRVEASGTADAVVESMLPRLFSPATRERRPQVMATVHDLMAKTSSRAIAGALRGMAARPDRTADLAGLTLPTLVLVGADDVITPPDEARTMAASLPNSRLEVIPNAGHLAPLENPEDSNRAILAFLNAVP